MDWNTEFNIDIKKVAQEVRQIRKEKKIQYVDKQKYLIYGVLHYSYMPHPEENYLVEKLCRLLEAGKDQEYILKKYGTSGDVIQALLDAEDFVKLQNMKSSGKVVVAIQNKKGDFWQVALNEEAQGFVLNALSQYFEGTIKILNNKLPFEPVDNSHCNREGQWQYGMCRRQMGGRAQLNGKALLANK